MTHHYSYGSGMPGCLYDNGPNFSPTLRDAIAGLVWLFAESGSESDLSPAEVKRMRRNLRVNGIHYFEHPQDAGAVYCEVSKQPGPCPKDDES